jgi:signal transduction histidine kinase
MTRRSLLGSERLRRVWTSRFWILAAVLGAITIYTAVITIHDNTQRGLAARLVTQASAIHASTLASARLERLALEAFAPVGPLAPSLPGPSTGQVTIDGLANRQREGVACACRELLPATQFLHYDVATGEFSSTLAGSTDPGRAAAPDSVLIELARTASREPRAASNAASRLVVDPRLRDDALVALVQRDERGAALAVYGIVVKAEETLAALFSRNPHRSAIDSVGLTRLDSLSYEVRTPSGERVFGALGAGRLRALVRLGGPLRGLMLTIAVAPGRIASPLMAPHSRTRLWQLGALLAATVLVVGIAASSTRREVLLARARSDFIAGVSHDLRMPLAQILIASETLSLRRERSEAERTALASSIVRETRRLMGVVDNVLLFSRSGAVDLRPVMRPIAIGALLSEVIDAVRLAVEDAAQTIEVVVTGPPATLVADRRLVRQALVNLVDNALKYGATGQCIRLSAESDGAVVRLVVEDDGPGVPPNERARIFEPYARLAHDQVSERTGT